MAAGKKKSKKAHAKTVLSPRRAAPVPAPPPLARYALGKELGRGGLGRVVEAVDRDIGRAVALKLLLEGAPLDVVERFRREGRITGRLEHPNIVPVHEVGTLPGSGGEIFFAMKKIAGRDLADALREFRAGKGGWTLRRLVEIFRDVGRAMAFAHSKGVIHRDLKPSNIMVGEFGEVLVVDWGLAKDGRETRAGGRGAAAPADPMLTLDGDVFGTPDYMSPEQAEGRVADVDERSDVFSLGAILYEMLAGRPPFTGGTTTEILRRVVSDAPTRPSDLVKTRSAAPGPAPAIAAVALSVPPELEAICLRALSKVPAARHPSAGALQSDVQSWLDGDLDRERLGRHASTHLEAARDHVSEWRRLSQESADLARAADRKLAATPSFEGVEKKTEAWRAEDEAARLATAALRAFADAEGDLATALSLVPTHAEARRLRAELSWERFLDAERDGRRSEMVLYRRAAERWNDGALDAALKDEGEVAVSAVAYRCDCLRKGRALPAEERRICGYDPWDGAPADRPGEGAPGAGPAPATARVHGPRCAKTPVDGADVWAWRFEETERILLPRAPRPAGPAAPAELLEAVFGNSPFRPRDGGVWLGRTPLPPLRLPIGSWIFIASAARRAPARALAVVRRGEPAKAEALMFEAGEAPDGFLTVGAGAYERLANESVVFRHSEDGSVSLDDILFARHPVTCDEYAAFLNDLRHRDEGAAFACVPRHGASVPYWPRDAGGDWLVPTEEVLKRFPPEAAENAKFQDPAEPWHGRWPVLGVSWRAATAYCRWLTARTGFFHHLPHEDQIEKAWRGFDGRLFPWGQAFDPAFCNTNASRPVRPLPAPVDEFPHDESPWGVRGLAGNASQMALNLHGPRFPRHRVTKGGSWANPGAAARISTRTAWDEHSPNWRLGFRVAAAVRLPVDWEALRPETLRPMSTLRI